MGLMLYKLFGIIDLSFGTIISFLIGILFGMMLICLLYAIAVTSSLGSKRFIVKTEEDGLTAEQVKDLVVAAQKAYSDKNLRGKKSRLIHCKDICYDLVYGIACKFYPNKKYPLLELSVDEILMLVKYVSDRFNEILSKRGLKIFKKFKASQIFSIVTKSGKVVDSKAFKVTKEVSGVTSKVMNALSVINPAKIVRKVFMDTTINMIEDKLFKILIALIGEETYKVYSKKVFNADVEVETNVEDLVDEIQDDLKEDPEEEMTEDEKAEASDEVANAIVDGILFKARPMQANDSTVYVSKFDSEMPMANKEE